MGRLKKRSFGPRLTRIPSGESVENKRVADRVRRNLTYHERRENGCCENCDQKAVTIIYEQNGKVVLTRIAMRCADHWGKPEIRRLMQDALATV